MMAHCHGDLPLAVKEGLEVGKGWAEVSRKDSALECQDVEKKIQSCGAPSVGHTHRTAHFWRRLPARNKSGAG